MSPELTLYYDGVSLKSIVGNARIKSSTMRERLKKERKELGLDPRPRLPLVEEFVSDKMLVLDLIRSGVSEKDIAEKWELTVTTVYKYLRSWGVLLGDDVKNIEFHTLSELYKNWTEMPTEAIITINRKPTFKLVRIL